MRLIDIELSRARPASATALQQVGKDTQCFSDLYSRFHFLLVPSQ
jgi:hypothetical protein